MTGGEKTWRCSPAGIWLPRVLAGAVLAASLFASRALDPGDLYRGSGLYRGLVVTLGALLSLWVLKDGAVVKWSVQVRPKGIAFSTGRKSNLLEYRDIVTIDYHPPFSAGKQWVPAVILEDRLGGRWRIPTFIPGGAEWLSAFLEASGKEELAAWADAREISRKMGRGIGSLRTWYVLACLILIWGGLLPFLASS